MEIIVRSKGSRWSSRKDVLHSRRKELAGNMQDGMMSRSQMMRGHDGDGNEDKQTEKYDKWRKKNVDNMNEWHGINKEFKENKEEGKAHSLDDIRPDGKFKSE